MGISILIHILSLTAMKIQFYLCTFDRYIFYLDMCSTNRNATLSLVYFHEICYFTLNMAGGYLSAMTVIPSSLVTQLTYTCTFLFSFISTGY